MLEFDDRVFVCQYRNIYFPHLKVSNTGAMTVGGNGIEEVFTLWNPRHTCALHFGNYVEGVLSTAVVISRIQLVVLVMQLPV